MFEVSSCFDDGVELLDGINVHFLCTLFRTLF